MVTYDMVVAKRGFNEGIRYQAAIDQEILREKDAEIERIKAEIARKSAEIKRLDAEIRRTDAEIEGLDAQLASQSSSS